MADEISQCQKRNWEIHKIRIMSNTASTQERRYYESGLFLMNKYYRYQFFLVRLYYLFLIFYVGDTCSDSTSTSCFSIFSSVIVGCIMMRGKMNIHLSRIDCMNTIMCI